MSAAFGDARAREYTFVEDTRVAFECDVTFLALSRVVCIYSMLSFTY